MTDAVEHVEALIVGAGPAGLMAADILSAAGAQVVVAEAKPSPARKFLMAGKSGLNLTKNEPLDTFIKAYAPVPNTLRHALKTFGPQEAIAWAEGLGQEMFTGSSGRVFPRAMKGSPLLRAWLARLEANGVKLRRNWLMTGLGEDVVFVTPDGVRTLRASSVILALGGASWARLGSNGAWTELVSPFVQLAPFAPSNVGVNLTWTPHMTRFFGTPLKGIRLTAGPYDTRGECVISERGLEGSGIYTVSRGLRDGASLKVDLLPDWSPDRVKQTLTQRKTKETLTKFLTRAFRLPPEKRAFLMEFAGSKPANLAQSLKALNIRNPTLRPLDEAISTAGGVMFESLTHDLEAKNRPGLFFAGEMLDWDAPTGGYLLTACLASGQLAARGAIKALS